MKKTDMTSTRHILPFSNLSYKDFERLCYWVVEKSSNFDIVEHYGMTGDKKRDIIAYKHNKAGKPEQWYFQCKNYKEIYFAILRNELDAIKNYSDKEKDFKPDGIIFVTGCSVSSRCKDQVKEYAVTLSLGPVYFWTNVELDEKAKAIEGVIEEFFSGGFSSDDIVKKIIEEIKPPLPLVLDNLPSPKTDYFIGRKAKKIQIINALRRDTHRILITGFPGVGKTTLVIEIAHFCAREKTFEAIIWITSEPERRITLDIMLDIVAETLNYEGCKRFEKDDKLNYILKLLRSWKCLIILDNFETIKDSEVYDFLNKLPVTTQLIVISHCLSTIQGEETIFINEMNEHEAFEFIKVKSKMKRLSKASDEVLNRIYKTTGGLPLAIDWAIGQINTGRQTLENVIGEIATAKAATLYSTLFNTSYTVCNDKEKQIIWALSIFIGSATKTALRIVSGLEDDELNESLKQLIEMHLIYDNGEFEEKKVRYSTHILTRNFARQQLNMRHSTIFDYLSNRFIDYFLDYSKKRRYEMKDGPKGRYDEIAIEFSNITTVMNWSYDRHYDRKFLDILNSLSYFYAIYGYWAERIRRGYQAIEICERLGDKRRKAWVCINDIGYIFIQQGKFESAEQLISEGKGILENEYDKIKEQGKLQEDSKDQRGVQFMMGIALRYMGILFTRQSKFDAAEQYFMEAMEIFKYLKRRSIIANQKIEMGDLAFYRGDYNTAQHHYQNALDYHLKKKDKKIWIYSWLSKAYIGVGNIKCHQKKYIDAKKNYSSGLDCAMKVNGQDGIAHSKYGLAVIEEQSCNYKLALKLFQESLLAFLRVGDKNYIEKIEEKIKSIKSVIDLPLSNNTN